MDDSSTPNTEPTDYHVYSCVSFDEDSITFFLKAFEFYFKLLENDIEEIKKDEDLREVLGDESLMTFEIHKEYDRIKGMMGWFKEIIDRAKGSFDYDIMNITHGTICYIKSAVKLYVSHLKTKRNSLSLKPNLSKYALAAVDNFISKHEEILTSGVFKNATPKPLLCNAIVSQGSVENNVEKKENLSEVARPLPIIIDSIEILDSELRSRCLDLFALFQKDGKLERLDTVVTEATRIFESRIRNLISADANCMGVDLATAAFGSDKPKLVVSSNLAEQEAAHLLYRGVFGFIRNPVHHKLVEGLIPERVIQILGLIDYLLHLADNAQISQKNKREER